MTIHLVKLAVGIEDVAHLARVQKARIETAARAGQKTALRHVTRHRPRRADEIAAGGSLYWVIGGAIAARQRILGFEAAAKADGTRAHAILLDPRLVRTLPRSIRPFQGWRYLTPERAPPDATGAMAASLDALPNDLKRELKDLGLL